MQSGHPLNAAASQCLEWPQAVKGKSGAGCHPKPGEAKLTFLDHSPHKHHVPTPGAAGHAEPELQGQLEGS